MVTVFILNRHLTEAMELDMAILGFDGLTLAKHLTIGGQGQDLREASTADAPGQGRAARRQRASASTAAGWLARCRRLSYHVVRLRAA